MSVPSRISGNVVNVPDATMQELIMSNVVAFILRFKITAIIIKYLEQLLVSTPSPMTIYGVFLYHTQIW